MKSISSTVNRIKIAKQFAAVCMIFIALFLTASLRTSSEDRLGTLEAGKEADLAVLSQDMFSVGAMELDKTRVVMTMVGGNIVFNKLK